VRLSFQAASETGNAPTLAEYPATMLWASFVGYLSGFAISISFTVQISMGLIIVVLLVIITLFVALGERERSIRITRSTPQKV
jgi:tetrahydromethanopterin S-methyltransferase subunit E